MLIVTRCCFVGYEKVVLRSYDVVLISIHQVQLILLRSTDLRYYGFRKSCCKVPSTEQKVVYQLLVCY